MPLFRKKVTKIIMTILSVILVLSIISYVGDNPLQRMVNTVMSPVFNTAYSVITPIRSFSEHLSKASEYEKEIEDLKSQLNTLKIENKSRESYIIENRRLKELLDLRDNTMAGYETVTARVVSYEPSSWYDTVMLNKGSTSGIEMDDIVVTGLGVVGRVTELGKNWATVSTVINISNSVGIKLSRTGDVGVVSGDANLAEDKNCRLEYLSNDKNLIKGDILVTSGLGGIYPPDLTVGKVTEVKSDSAGNLDYAVVEPSVDFSSLYEVLVITHIPDIVPNDTNETDIQDDAEELQGEVLE